MKRFKRILLTATAAVVGATASTGSVAVADTIITSLTPGDLVVLRGGDTNVSNNSSAPTASGEVHVYLDEYTTSGTYVGTIAVPSLTLPGQNANSHEGGLNLSANGQYLTFGGYDPVQNPAGTTPRLSDGTVNDVIARIGASAASPTTVATIAGAATAGSSTSQTGQFLRAVNSADGNSFYVLNKFTANSAAGNYVGTNTDNAGLVYIHSVGGSAGTLQPGTDWRSVAIFNNTLYGGTGSSSVGTHGGFLIGGFGNLPTNSNVTVTPTTTSLTHTLLTNYAGGQSASNLALLNVSTSDASASIQNGANVMYTIGDQGVAGITKYYFDGTTWQHANNQVALNATNVINPTGLATRIDPQNNSWVDIFVTGSNGLYSYIDKSGDPLTGIAANSFTSIAAPLTSDYAFYGMALAPNAVPEPTSVALVSVFTGLAFLTRRRGHSKS